MPNPTPCDFVIQVSTLPGLSHVIGLTWKRLKCRVEDKTQA